MSISHRWQVEIFVDDHPTGTHAEARLHTQDRTALVGTGVAETGIVEVPEIADELAVSRALAHLSELLRDAAAADAAALSKAAPGPH